MLTTVGAWCVNPSVADINFAQSLGIKRLDMMVNDLSACRLPIRFQMQRPANVKHAIDCGMEVHFTSWIMPHVDFCKRAGDELQQLCLDTGAHGVVLDAEEPWTLAHVPQREEAAVAFAAGMMGCRFGVTGIGYASERKLDPLLDVADYGIPQAYATRTSGLPVHKVDDVLAHWRAKFDHIPIVPALPAYRTNAQDMGESLRLVMPADTVIYWALRHIKTSNIAKAFIKSITR